MPCPPSRRRGLPGGGRPSARPAAVLTYRRDVPARRHPRFLPFILTGAVLGFAIGAYLATRGTDEATRTTGVYSATSAIGYLGFLGAALLGLLGGVVALVVDRVVSRR